MMLGQHFEIRSPRTWEPGAVFGRFLLGVRKEPRRRCLLMTDKEQLACLANRKPHCRDISLAPMLPSAVIATSKREPQLSTDPDFKSCPAIHRLPPLVGAGSQRGLRELHAIILRSGTSRRVRARNRLKRGPMKFVPVGDTADRSLNWRSRAGLVDRDLEMRSSDPPIISCGEVESLGRVPFFEIDKFRLSVSAEAFGRWPVGAKQS
jgi:hypothetical protein